MYDNSCALEAPVDVANKNKTNIRFYWLGGLHIMAISVLKLKVQVNLLSKIGVAQSLSQADLAPYFDIVFRCAFLDLIVVGVILYDGPVPW